jgi:hypothetical protein
MPQAAPSPARAATHRRLLEPRGAAPTRQREVERGWSSESTAKLSFTRRVRRSTIRHGSRDIVLATYHNIGMLDWATLFWGWLEASGIDRFFLLELDGLTCDATRALNCSIKFECATAADMMLSREQTSIRQASALQDWGAPAAPALAPAIMHARPQPWRRADRACVAGTSAESGYFKFLRWKLRFVELILALKVDVLMADVDVLIVNPQFLATLAAMDSDLVISSDARKGTYSDNVNCPCSHPMYQQYAAD